MLGCLGAYEPYPWIQRSSLQFNGTHLTVQFVEVGDCWDLRVPLNHSGHVYLRVPLHSEQPPHTIGRLVTTLGTVFANKLAEFPVRATSPSAEEAINLQLNALAAASSRSFSPTTTSV